MAVKQASIAKITRPSISGILLRKRLFRPLDNEVRKSLIWIFGSAVSVRQLLIAEVSRTVVSGILISCIAVLFVIFSPVDSYSEDTAQNDITELIKLDIDDLVNLEVTLASRKSEKLSEVPAAIYVITGEDIRRSGATTIPEALRMVPGLQVAQIDTDTWAVSSRGFNDLYSNKLLVQIDGRTVYSPVFAGVVWNRQDVLMEDIDRIEVVRGPGASLWGANAVNGIINIVTKSAKDTQGGLVTLGGAGYKEKFFNSVRYGGKLNENLYYKVYAKYFDRFKLQEDKEGWSAYSGGFRLDWDLSSKDSLTLQGDIYRANAHQEIELTGNVRGHWRHVISKDSDIALQLYYDRVSEETEKRHSPPYRELIKTFDTDFQHRFRLGGFQEIIWGFGARLIVDRLSSDVNPTFVPDGKDTYLYSAFLQDDISVIKDRLRFILGLKLEHNDFTGFELQPNVRVLWTPDHRHTAWAAVSRAVRTPSRAEETIRFKLEELEPGVDIDIIGNPGFGSEELVAYELGYRIRPANPIVFDIAAFYNVYDNLRTIEQGEPFVDGETLVVPLFPENKMDGETYGIEIAAAYQPLKWWRFTASYSHLKIQLHLDADSTDTLSERFDEGKSPRNQFSLRSLMNVTRNLEFDTSVYYVDNLPATDVRSFFAVDARIGWKPSKNLDVSVIGRNMLDPRHVEFHQAPLDEVDSVEVVRDVFLKLTWQF